MNDFEAYGDTIWIPDKFKGTFKGIACFWGGQPEPTGNMLLKYYNTKERVDKLFKLGHLVKLCEKIDPNPNEPHTYENPQPKVCIAFARDNNEIVGESWYKEDHEYSKGYLETSSSCCNSRSNYDFASSIFIKQEYLKKRDKENYLEEKRSFPNIYLFENDIWLKYNNRDNSFEKLFLEKIDEQ